MILIAERINGGFSEIAQAIKDKDKGPIQKWARLQTDCGADFLDVNMGTVTRDPGAMVWMVEAVQEVVDTPIVIDSPRSEVVKRALEVCENERMINSTTAVEERLNSLIPLAVEYDASLIGVTSGDGGSPQDVGRRLENAATIFTAAIDHGLKPQKLFLDPIAMPLKFMQEQAKNILEAIKQLTVLSDPPPHITLGLSNMASDAIQRSLINRTFLVMAICAGLDSAICDVTDKKLMNSVATAELIMNNEIYSDSYLDTYRMS
jgi:5-methyltetrahydrofolate corrinoid/iron sulfur protein methyltransferase